ncbi:MAG: histidine phosphatase family protein [Tetrasphaera sp.]|nr:histidine phosphatase family protein [Tetrasphaera sp.]
MSLHCPARLFVARPGEATDAAGASRRGDAGGTLSDVGREQAAALARRLEPQRVAAAYSSALGRAIETAEVVGTRLGVPTRALAGLDDIRVGDCAGPPAGDRVCQDVLDAWAAGDLAVRMPGAESGAEVVARVRAALEEIADLHRGEQVVVVTHGAVMSLVLPRLAGTVPADLAVGRPVPHAHAVELTIGDDGWALTGWPEASSA